MNAEYILKDPNILFPENEGSYLRIDSKILPKFLKSLVPPGEFYSNPLAGNTILNEKDPLVNLFAKIHRKLVFYEVLMRDGYSEHSNDRCRIRAMFRKASEHVILTIENDGKIREEPSP